MGCKPLVDAVMSGAERQQRYRVIRGKRPRRLQSRQAFCCSQLLAADRLNCIIRSVFWQIEAPLNAPGRARGFAAGLSHPETSAGTLARLPTRQSGSSRNTFAFSESAIARVATPSVAV
jgi:hypothetical protein